MPEPKLYTIILKDFLSVRSIITLGAFLLLYYMIWEGKPIPNILLHIVDLLLGFWFGQKIGKALTKGETNGINSVHQRDIQQTAPKV